jgi:DNA-binding protein HU-beta
LHTEESIVTKSDLVSTVATAANLNKKQATAVVDQLLEDITSALKSGEKVAIAGFGSFQVKATAARQGINPFTKQPMTIPAKKKLKFSAAKQLKELVK